jgi:AraC-like DNA-binding protein
MAKMGRPKKEIDFEALEKLCMIQCTEEEIAAYFGISIDTLERRINEQYNQTFAEYFAQNRGKGKMSLRRAQYTAAMAGNTTMLVWLGKNWLSQTDKQEISHQGDNIIKVRITDD